MQLAQSQNAFFGTFTCSIMKFESQCQTIFHKDIWGNNIICQHFNKLGTLYDKKIVPGHWKIDKNIFEIRKNYNVFYSSEIELQ